MTLDEASIRALYNQGRYEECRIALETPVEKGDLFSILLLGNIFLRGGRGVPRDLVRARALHELACQKTANSPVERQLAFLYYRGKGGARDRRLARQLFRRSALHGDPITLAILASIYRRESPKKRRMARRMFKLAAKNSKLAWHFRALLWVNWLL